MDRKFPWTESLATSQVLVPTYMHYLVTHVYVTMEGPVCNFVFLLVFFVSLCPDDLRATRIPTEWPTTGQKFWANFAQLVWSSSKLCKSSRNRVQARGRLRAFSFGEKVLLVTSELFGSVGWKIDPTEQKKRYRETSYFRGSLFRWTNHSLRHAW